MSFLAKLTEALNAQTFPPLPEGAGWNQLQPGEQYYGPACPRDAHLFLLFLESEGDEYVVMENLWFIHLRGMAAKALNIKEDDVEEKMMEVFEIRNGWKWYKS